MVLQKEIEFKGKKDIIDCIEMIIFHLYTSLKDFNETSYFFFHTEL